VNSPVTYYSDRSAIHRDLHPFPTRRSSDLAEVFQRHRESRQVQAPAFHPGPAFGEMGGGHRVEHRAGGADQIRRPFVVGVVDERSEEHTSELQSRENLVCRLLLEKKKLPKE